MGKKKNKFKEMITRLPGELIQKETCVKVLAKDL